MRERKLEPTELAKAFSAAAERRPIVPRSQPAANQVRGPVFFIRSASRESLGRLVVDYRVLNQSASVPDSSEEAADDLELVD